MAGVEDPSHGQRPREFIQRAVRHIFCFIEMITFVFVAADVWAEHDGITKTERHQPEEKTGVL